MVIWLIHSCSNIRGNIGHMELVVNRKMGAGFQYSIPQISSTGNTLAECWNRSRILTLGLIGHQKLSLKTTTFICITQPPLVRETRAINCELLLPNILQV